MMLKIEDLKVGDELVCLDVETYLTIDNQWVSSRRKIIESSLIVDHIYENGAIGLKGTDYCIPEFELQYFKKKEQSQQCTFDDLIDVAVQAYKDRVIGNLFIGDTYVDFDSGNDRYGYDITCLSSGINFIKSLYKETFVIEVQEDLKRIKDTAQITMPNKEILDYKDAISLERYTNSFILKLLKGATVTQSK